MSPLNLGLPAFEVFLQSLSLPDACLLNKVLFKKMFDEHSEMVSADKKVLKENISKIRWLYTLKPQTINIAPFQDAERDYSEIAVLHIGINNPQKAERIALFINRAIPYPLVIFFTSETENEEDKTATEARFCIALANKRLSKADTEKWVVEESLLSPWVQLEPRTKTADAFISSLNSSNLPFGDFWQFYQALFDRLIALECAQISGCFQLPIQPEQGNEQRANLEQYRQTEDTISQLRRQIKHAAFNEQVALNTQIKQLQKQHQQLAKAL